MPWFSSPLKEFDCQPIPRWTGGDVGRLHAPCHTSRRPQCRGRGIRFRIQHQREPRTSIDYAAARIVRAETPACTASHRVRTARSASTTVTPTLLPTRSARCDVRRPILIADAGVLDATTPRRRTSARRRLRTTLEWNAEWDEDRAGTPLMKSLATGCFGVRLTN